MSAATTSNPVSIASVPTPTSYPVELSLDNFDVRPLRHDGLYHGFCLEDIETIDTLAGE